GINQDKGLDPTLHREELGDPTAMAVTDDGEAVHAEPRQELPDVAGLGSDVQLGLLRHARASAPEQIGGDDVGPRGEQRHELPPQERRGGEAVRKTTAGLSGSPSSMK